MFEVFCNQVATDEKRVRILRVAKELHLNDEDDFVWAILIALDYHNELYREIPSMIADQRQATLGQVSDLLGKLVTAGDHIASHLSEYERSARENLRSMAKEECDLIAQKSASAMVDIAAKEMKSVALVRSWRDVIFGSVIAVLALSAAAYGWARFTDDRYERIIAETKALSQEKQDAAVSTAIGWSSKVRFGSLTEAQKDVIASIIRNADWVDAVRQANRTNWPCAAWIAASTIPNLPKQYHTTSWCAVPVFNDLK